MNRFPSLTLPNEHGYLISDNYFDFDRNAVGIARWCGIYDTYGDGNIQHSPHRPIVRNFMADFLASLAKQCLEDEKLTEQVAGFWPRQQEVGLLGFALTIKYDEGKKQYYSLEERKISKSESKRHDKRWYEVPQWADGKPANALGIIFTISSYNDIERYAIARQMQQYLTTLPTRFLCGRPEDWVGLKAPHLDWAFEAADKVIQAHLGRKRALRAIDGYLYGYLSNIENDRLRAQAKET